MANSPQARKRIRQNHRAYLANSSQMTRLRTLIKRIRKACDVKDVDLAKTTYSQFQSYVDRCVKLGHVHKNKAARLKSRLNVSVRALA